MASRILVSFEPMSESAASACHRSWAGTSASPPRQGYQGQVLTACPVPLPRKEVSWARAAFNWLVPKYNTITLTSTLCCLESELQGPPIHLSSQKNLAYYLVHTSTMDPYAIEPEHIPVTDSYADIPLFGLYCPKPGDFSVKLEHVTCQSSAAMQYWESVVSLCDATRLYPADESGPDVFALGNIIVKSHHLHYTGEIDYSFADSNEVEAISIAKDVLGDIKVPEIYFAGKVLILPILSQLCHQLCHQHTYTTSDTRPPSVDPRKTPRCCLVCCMAISRTSPKVL